MHRFLFTAVASVALLPAAALRAEEDDLDTRMMRATVKISDDKTVGTGFILTRPDPRDRRRTQHVLITAGHVFEGMPGNEATVFFRKKESEGIYHKVPAKLLLRKDGKPRWTKHATQDVAVLVIVPPANVDLPKLSVDLLAGDRELRKIRIHPGENLSCLGYPHRVEASEAGFPVLRTGALASYPILPTRVTRTFLFSASSFEGDSGGPVYLSGDRRSQAGADRLIVGLVTGQMFLDEEMKMVYGTSKIRHRLSLATVVHASFIRETLARLP